MTTHENTANDSPANVQLARREQWRMSLVPATDPQLLTHTHGHIHTTEPGW